MNGDDVRRLLLQQRRLFGSQKKLAEALGVSEHSLSLFLTKSHPSIRADSVILKALGLTVESKVVCFHEIKPKEEL